MGPRVRGDDVEGTRRRQPPGNLFYLRFANHESSLSEEEYV